MLQRSPTYLVLGGQVRSRATSWFEKCCRAGSLISISPADNASAGSDLVLVRKTRGLREVVRSLPIAGP